MGISVHRISWVLNEGGTILVGWGTIFKFDYNQMYLHTCMMASTHACTYTHIHTHTHLYLSTPWYKNSQCLKLLNHALVVLIPRYRYTMT